MSAAIKLRQSNLARQPGETGRLKVVSGPDFGSTYVLKGPSISIGRGDENDVVLTDLKTSRKHARLSRTPEGWRIEDQKSANGLQVNGRSLPNGWIKSGDVLALGETVLEFFPSEVDTQMLAAPVKSADAIQADQAALLAGKRRVQALGQAASLPTVGAGAVPKKKSNLLILGLVAAGVALFLMEGETPRPQKKAKTQTLGQSAEEDLSQFLPEVEVPLNRTAEMFFKAGFRELREKNYQRARVQFETVLQMAPNHTLSQLYLRQCENGIKEEGKKNLEGAKKNLAAGRVAEAKGQLQAVMRWYHRDPQNPDYLEALEQLRSIDRAGQSTSQATSQAKQLDRSIGSEQTGGQRWPQ